MTHFKKIGFIAALATCSFIMSSITSAEVEFLESPFQVAPVDSTIFTIQEVTGPQSEEKETGFGPNFLQPYLFQSYEFKVYSRWGQEFFSTTDPQARWMWNTKGKKKKSPMLSVPNGTYFYRLTFQLEGDSERAFQGNVTVVGQ